MSYHSHHRILTPGASRKRKETEAFYSVQPSTTPPSPQPTSSSAQAGPISSNQILAGYMAYEFLTKGTLFGQKFDPARGNALPLSPTPTPTSAATDLKKTKLNQKTVAAEPNNRVRGAPVKQHESYTEVASLLKADGAHIPGIVNPTQLARWIQM